MGDGEHCTASERILRQIWGKRRKYLFFSHLVKCLLGSNSAYVKNRYEVIWTLLFPPEIIAILIHVWIPIISFEWASIPSHQIGNVWKSSNLRDSWWKRAFWRKKPKLWIQKIMFEKKILLLKISNQWLYILKIFTLLFFVSLWSLMGRLQPWTWQWTR